MLINLPKKPHLTCNAQDCMFAKLEDFMDSCDNPLSNYTTADNVLDVLEATYYGRDHELEMPSERLEEVLMDVNFT